MRCFGNSKKQENEHQRAKKTKSIRQAGITAEAVKEKNKRRYNFVMKQLEIGENEAGQRLDKYLKKLLPHAESSFLYKMLRKKNIVLNGKKAQGAVHLVNGDTVTLYLSDETYEKFSANKVFYSNVNPQWIEGTHQFWYVRNTPDGRLYVSVDADKKARKELFDSHRLAKALGAASGKEVSRKLLHWGICRSVRDWIRCALCLIINVGCMRPGKISWSMKVRFPSLSGKSIGWRWMMRRRHHRFRLLMVNGSHLLKIRISM